MGGRGSWSSGGGGGGSWDGGGNPSGNYTAEPFNKGSLGNSALEQSIDAVEVDLMNQFSAFRDGAGVQMYTTNSNGLNRAYAFASNDGVYINKNKFQNSEQIERSYASDVKSGFHPKGTTAGDIVVHEYGHVAETMLNRKYPVGSTFMGVTVTSRNSASNIMAQKAVKSANTATGKKQGINAWANSVSRYANKNRSEFIAEAFSDWYANGKKANKVSQEIVKVFKKELN